MIDLPSTANHLRANLRSARQAIDHMLTVLDAVDPDNLGGSPVLADNTPAIFSDLVQATSRIAVLKAAQHDAYADS